MIRQQLPIDFHLPSIVQTLASNNCLILQAPPGTGKTTRVAPALMTEMNAWSVAGEGAGGAVTSELLLIQPRRIAARAAAARIAQELGCRVGEEVGYQVRFDARLGKSTRLICMTPGILLRRLQRDALLERVALVLLDEFHERSLEVDLLLGMLRRIQSTLRPELRIVLMSATLEADTLQAVLGAPPVIEVASPAFPVTICHSRFQATGGGRRGSPPGPVQQLVGQTTETILRAAGQAEGDLLAFLPGVGEIQQVARRLEPEAAKQGWELLTLFGDMTAREQDRVLLPSTRRKVILSTNVAETSLTIDGVRIVVDSGWARVQRVDAALGLNMLVLEPISQASARQRAGRAGRTAPGRCYRLWDQVADRSRPQQLEPEILRVDLAGAALQLLAWGERDFSDFPWITPPRDNALQRAAQVLELLEATREGRLTDLGQALLKLPVHPRIGRFLLEAHRLGIPRTGAMAAAILSERDIFVRRREATARAGGPPPTRGPQVPHDCDLTQRVFALQRFQQSGQESSPLGTLNPGAARNVHRIAQQFYRLLSSELGERPEAELGAQIPQALLAAFPDRLARRRGPGDPRGLMVGGRGVKLDPASGVSAAELFLCLEVEASGSEARVRQASAVEAEWLPLEHLREADERFFHPTLGAVCTRRRLFWLDLQLSETPLATPTDELTARLLAAEAAKQFPRLLPAKDRELHSWLARARWLAEAMPESGLPSWQGPQLAQLLEGWCYGMKSLDELKTLPWKSLLPSALNATQRKELDRAAPATVTLPSGRQVLLQYEAGKPPVLAARIQEFMGLRETPRLAGGRVPLLLHLLAPNNRCQQITNDLASFWVNTYPHVRKELRGRYPKHAWPEDPMQATGRQP